MQDLNPYRPPSGPSGSPRARPIPPALWAAIGFVGFGVAISIEWIVAFPRVIPHLDWNEESVRAVGRVLEPPACLSALILLALTRQRWIWGTLVIYLGVAGIGVFFGRGGGLSLLACGSLLMPEVRDYVRHARI